MRAHCGHAVAVAEADPDALRVVVDDYEALDVLAFAAEAAAELAELHQQRGDARLAAAAMQRSASWRRGPAACARHRWRVAAGSSR